MSSEDVAVRLVIPPPAAQQPSAPQDSPAPAASTPPGSTPSTSPAPSAAPSPAAPVPLTPGTSPDPGSTPGTSVPVAGPTPAPFDLPRTGVELISLLLLAAVLVVVGAALVRSGRTSETAPRTSEEP